MIGDFKECTNIKSFRQVIQTKMYVKLSGKGLFLGGESGIAIIVLFCLMQGRSINQWNVHLLNTT